MSFKKLMILTCSALIFSSTPLLAKTYKLKEIVEHSCSDDISDDSSISSLCDFDSMETTLLYKCYDDGYMDCAVTNSTKFKKVHSPICGKVYQETCKVKVKTRI